MAFLQHLPCGIFAAAVLCTYAKQFMREWREYHPNEANQTVASSTTILKGHISAA